MKILLLGRNGQVGWELQRSLAPLGDIVALDRGDDPSADFLRPDELIRTVKDVGPDVIVNAAAYTAVDNAEKEPELAAAINAEGPKLLADQARELGAWLIHYSTDYVFDGTGDAARSETEPTAPLNVYGQTKLDGERAVIESGCKHLILRTSWVYAARGGNFAKTILRLAQERDQLNIINDQIGAPTGADLIADVTAHCLRLVHQQPELAGLYHLVAAGETSWHGYAQYALHLADEMGVALKVAPASLCAVGSEAFPTPAQRPKNSRLDTHKIRSAFDLHLPHWQTGVRRLLTELLDK